MLYPMGGASMPMLGNMAGPAQAAQMAQYAQMQQMQQVQQVQQMQQMQQMQAAAMMQMQMAGMAQMQMAGMMPMMQMGVPMASMMPMVQMPTATGKAREGEDFSACTPEDVAALELEIKEAERAAKITAKKSGSFVGLMARYIEDEGFGFISCPECKEVWDKSDIFVSGRNFVSSGIDVGDMVTFTVEKDGKDLPRCVNPKTLPELTKLKKRLSKMREHTKAATSLKRSLVLTPGPIPQGPDPKRAHLMMGGLHFA